LLTEYLKSTGVHHDASNLQIGFMVNKAISRWYIMVTEGE